MDELYKAQKWLEFSELFHKKYLSSDVSGQLSMLRMLLCEWRDERAMRAVVAMNTLDN